MAYSYCLQLLVNADPRMRSEALLGRDHRTLFVDLRNSNLKPAPGIHFYELRNCRATCQTNEITARTSNVVIGQTIIFSSCFFLSSSSFFFFSSPNLSGRRLDVYHTLAHGVALVRL